MSDEILNHKNKHLKDKKVYRIEIDIYNQKD